MADLASIASAAQEWLRANVTGGQQGNFFQTRHTRTPGIVAPMDPKFHAQYEANTDPLAVVRSSMMDAALKEALAREWAGVGKGFIQVQPYAAQDAPTLKHEQVHDIFAKGGLEGQEAGLLPLINPTTLAKIGGSPTYAAEGQDIGHQNMLMQEGSAYDLSGSDPNTRLRDEVIKLLTKTGKTTQASQLRSLTK